MEDLVVVDPQQTPVRRHNPSTKVVVLADSMVN